jgi:hypothetical protein
LRIIASSNHSQLYADYPLFIIANDRAPVRDSADKGGQFSGCYVDGLGNFTAQAVGTSTICRWSLRKRPAGAPFGIVPNFRARWSPNKTSNLIQNGDIVLLFSHADDSSAYRDDGVPPYFASPMASKPGDVTLCASRLPMASFYDPQWLGNDHFQDQKSAAVKVDPTLIGPMMANYQLGKESPADLATINTRMEFLGLFDPENWKNNIAPMDSNQGAAMDFGANEVDWDPETHDAVHNNHPDFRLWMNPDGTIRFPDAGALASAGRDGPQGTCLRERLYSKVVQAWKGVQDNGWVITPFKVTFLT